MSEDKKIKRPKFETPHAGGFVAEGSDKVMCELLGYSYSGNVIFTNEQVKALEKFYGFDFSSCKSDMEQTGSFRNLIRHVEMDGLRIMAFLAKHELLEKGVDPVKSLAWAIQQDYYRNPPDIWNEEEDEEKE